MSKQKSPPLTFKQWWHESGGKLPHDATRREVAFLAWSAAMEAEAQRALIARNSIHVLRAGRIPVMSHLCGICGHPIWSIPHYWQCGWHDQKYNTQGQK